MTFSTYFRASSYAMIACGMLALVVSGGVGPGLAAVFYIALVLAWLIEGTRRQLSEKVGLIAVLLALPLFYFDWKYQATSGLREEAGVSALAHLILFLAAVKLLQVKADRDWIFLYLISFFEVLLAAGLSISPSFLATLCLYMLFALSTIISFEIRKGRRGVKIAETRLLVAPDSTLIRKLSKRRSRSGHTLARRLPLVAFALLLLIFALAIPLFFIAPRYGANALTRSDNGLAGFVGFSDSVNLGAIGRLQRSDRVVMRVRVESSPAEPPRQGLYWRGVALDNFTGTGWRKSRSFSEQFDSERGFFKLDTTEALHRLTTQTFFLEPIDTPVLFAAPRAIALQGMLPYVRRDTEGALTTRPHNQQRISYKVYSDTSEPEEEILRADTEPYPPVFRYLLLHSKSLDPRIAILARDVIARAGARNRYDAARAIEEHLRNSYGYTLDLKAGGEEPLADFLFRVREGHCEYFSTAMAVMLRAQGIATRVVNGFRTGEYNDAAGAYTVRQGDAHSWVEVYFPETDSWVTFDPTPAAGRPVRSSMGVKAHLDKYAEALELLWIQYVVAYDKQEQRLLATSLRNQLGAYRYALAEKFDNLKTTLVELLNTAQGKNEAETSFFQRVRLVVIIAIAIFLAFLLLAFARRIARLGFRRGIKLWQVEKRPNSIVEFYERMTNLLAERGLRREADETPLEFASAAGIPEVMKITRAYNRVRYGEKDLSATEAAEIEAWLEGIEGKTVISDK